MVMSGGALFIAVFLACVVEAVEALTIVLAAGTGRDWRSAITGVVAGVAVLAVIVAVLGPAVTAIPLGGLRLVVGGLLLIFGLQWLRKAILRASGLKAVHDEDAIYAAELAAARGAPAGRRGVVADWYSFTLSFKGVVLEGLEVAFIALTFGANQQNIPLAVVAAHLRRRNDRAIGGAARRERWLVDGGHRVDLRSRSKHAAHAPDGARAGRGGLHGSKPARTSLTEFVPTGINRLVGADCRPALCAAPSPAGVRGAVALA